MESPYPVLLAASMAGILTYCDLDTIFDSPPTLSRRPWWTLTALWWGFVLINAILAGFLYCALIEIGYFKELSRWPKALVVGAGYSALVRLKFTTLSINGTHTPIGIETFYEGVKNLIHKRINRVIRAWRMEESKKLAQFDLASLRQQSKMLVLSDALMDDEQRKSATTWIDQITTSIEVDEEDRRLYLALFIITGQRRAP